MDIVDALRALTADEARAQAEEADAKAQWERKQAKAAELAEARRGLEFALARYANRVDRAVAHAPVQVPPEGVDPNGHGWIILNKQDRIIRAIREISRPCTVPEIRAKLASIGIQENPRNIKSSLNAMKGTGKVVNLRAGLWDIPDAGFNDFGPAVEAGPREASDDDVPSQGAVITGVFGPSQPVR